MLGDSAYGTAHMRTTPAEQGHTAIIRPPPLRLAIAGGFTTDEFTVDEAAGTATCPSGVTRRITATRRVVFGAACRDCPLRTRCTSSPRGRKLMLHPDDSLLRQARHDWATRPELPEAYRQTGP